MRPMSFLRSSSSGTLKPELRKDTHGSEPKTVEYLNKQKQLNQSKASFAVGIINLRFLL